MYPILLYDGVCGLCNRFVQFVLHRDRNGTFCFASLQSPFAARILARQKFSFTEFDTVYVVLEYEGPNESLLSRSDAALFVLDQLGSPWRALSGIVRLIPKVFRDPVYNVIARNRYRIFGRSQVCTRPRDADHKRFLDQQ
jgi:predicted DCC family thiol-disulfide oxidoreductase YuxK